MRNLRCILKVSKSISYTSSVTFIDDNGFKLQRYAQALTKHLFMFS